MVCLDRTTSLIWCIPQMSYAIQVSITLSKSAHSLTHSRSIELNSNNWISFDDWWSLFAFVHIRHNTVLHNKIRIEEQMFGSCGEDIVETIKTIWNKNGIEWKMTKEPLLISYNVINLNISINFGRHAAILCEMCWEWVSVLANLHVQISTLHLPFGSTNITQPTI